LSASVVAAGAFLLTPPIAPVGPPVDEGAVVVVDPTGQPLGGGGSATEFSLRLPDGAACPGDSASGNWLVQSFLIPVADDPGTIKYGVIGPEGTQFPLYAFDTRPFAHQITHVSDTAGAPGIIAAVPALSFAVFPPGYIPAGEYRIGIACTYFRQTARYWDTELTIVDAPDDVPSQFVWRVPNAPSDAPIASTSSNSGSNTNLWVIVGAIGLGATAAGWLIVQRRPRATPSTSP
jgi:hypothetical protein